MAENTIKVRQKQRYDTEANWKSKNPVLLAGEIAISSDKNGLMKVGDGKSIWTAIPYSKASLSKTDVTTALGYTPPTTNTTYSIGTSSTAGIVKLYTGTGSNTDGSMTQAAIKSALDGKSGTGHTHDLSTMINTLSTGSSVPTDADYYVAQYAGGGMATTTYHRRPVSALWSYIKAKTDGLYQVKGSYAPSSHKHGDADITDLDASKIKSGTIDIARLPQGALERCVVVADEAARLKLTTATVQKGDTVKVTATNKMYFVVDDTKLTSEAGYEVYTAGTATSAPWSGITGKPSTYPPSDHTHAYVIDCGNNAFKTTFAYSKAGLEYSEYTWLAAWNGYELRAVNKNQFATSGHTHSYLPLSGGTVTGDIGMTVGTASDRGIYITNTVTGKKVGLQVGSGTHNRGLYDFNGNKWMVFADKDDKVWVNGNAETASKLATARTIASTSNSLISFSAKFDGSGDVTGVLMPRTSRAYVNNKNNYPYHRIATYNTNASWNDAMITLLIPGGYQTAPFGIVNITLRTNNKFSDNTATVQWIVRNGFNVADVIAALYTASDKVYIDVYIKTPSAYAGQIIQVLAGGGRGSSEHRFTVINSEESNDTTTTDSKGSKESYASLAAAGTALYKAAYTKTVTGVDAGYVYKSAVADKANIINDSENGIATYVSYSKPGMDYNEYTWLAGWNNYELRAVNKNQFATAGHTHTSLVDSTDASSTCSMSYLASAKKYNEYNWVAVWDGKTIKSASKADFASSGHNHNIQDLNNYASHIWDATTVRPANAVLIGPNGSNGVANFRKLVAADLPSHTHDAISMMGTNSVTAVANDTVKNWGPCRNSVHYFSKAGVLKDQPSQYGFVLNISNGASEVHQLWMTQASGNMAHRGANAQGWTGTWRTILDSSNVSSYALTSDNVAKGNFNRSDLTTLAGSDWKKISALSVIAYWNGRFNTKDSSLEYCILGKFGSGAVRNITYGTAAPSGSANKGDIYIQIS